MKYLLAGALGGLMVFSLIVWMMMRQEYFYLFHSPEFRWECKLKWSDTRADYGHGDNPISAIYDAWRNPR